MGAALEEQRSRCHVPDTRRSPLRRKIDPDLAALGAPRPDSAARRDPRTNMRLYTADEVFAIARLAGREDAFERQARSAAVTPRLPNERAQVE